MPNPSYPHSVHLVLPGINYEVEVYDPAPAVARRTAASGGARQAR